MAEWKARDPISSVHSPFDKISRHFLYYVQIEEAENTDAFTCFYLVENVDN